MPTHTPPSEHSEPTIIDLVLPVEKAQEIGQQKKAIASALKISDERIIDFRCLKKSIDARQQQIKLQIRFEVGIDQPLPKAKKLEAHYPSLDHQAEQALIVGAGPAGIFAALRCIELGIQPILLERGKDASSRRFDLGPILKKGTVLENSNYCFGEGGAGTFSDGKLYTRSTKRGPIRKIYETLVAHGAPSQILVDAHPHIGSNLLPKVVMNMRKSILNAGGEVHFNTQISDLILDGQHIKGVQTSDQGAFFADTIILATGHSARDIYRILQRQKVRLEQKAFAVGVRIEHPQALIDAIQYKQAVSSGRPRYLPAASYRLATKIDHRGVHSFCMCPGGFIVPASTENDAVVVNGMSLSRRDSPFANSGMVVSVEPEDTRHFSKEHGVLAGIAFQAAIERSAKLAGGGGQVAPGQRVTDFLAQRASASLPKTSYFPGIRSQRIDQLLPDWIVQRLSQGLELFGRQMKGYLTEECNLIGFETRTSSPVRIPRDAATLQHPEVVGLYPCGEGAGFAGGIVSAALDGMRCAEATHKGTQTK
jgi:uncharacterized FAD-dependent dehydrogenase